MRKLLVALLLFGLGIGGAVIVAKPAGAHTTIDGTLTGSVGSSDSHEQQVITLSSSDVADGIYEFDITDYATSHNFDICPGSSRCTSGTSIDKTSQAGTGMTTWDITLTDGEYTYQCDFHPSMTKHLFVGTATTTTATTTTTTTTTQPTTTTPTTTHSTTTTPTTTHATTTTTTQPTTTTTQPTTTTSTPLIVHIVSAKSTAHEMVVKISSNKHGKAVAQLFKGTKRLAKASHAVPGKVTLKPAHALKPGSYTVKVSVTAGGRHATAKKTVKVS